MLSKVNVQTNKREEKVFLIHKDEFFKKLVHYGIRKSSKPYDNLNDFLKLDKQYKDLFLFKKLVKTLEVFQSNNLFNSIGLKVSPIN